jgi:hypothetical protein
MPLANSICSYQPMPQPSTRAKGRSTRPWSSPVMTQHYPMLQRNLLYTGVTRGKKLVVLVGQKKAVAIAVRNVSGRRRWSKLQEWLRPAPSCFTAVAEPRRVINGPSPDVRFRGEARIKWNANPGLLGQTGSLLALRYSYSINSSALSRIDVGTSRPSALAVVMSTVSVSPTIAQADRPASRS